MNTRLQAIAQRRAALVREIAIQRDRSAAQLAELRTQLALAGLALVAARLLRRPPPPRGGGGRAPRPPAPHPPPPPRGGGRPE